MDITSIGSLGSYMRMLEKQTQWQMRKDSGDYTSHKKSLEEWLEETSAQTSSTSLMGQGEEKKNNSMELQTIYLKIQSGKKLTQKEKDYLRTHDPEVYAKAQSIEQERKAYEEEIKRCKTKEDVQRLKMSRINTSLASVNEISNNPNIPLEKKLQYVMLENAKVSAINEVTQKFVEKGEYGKLPTEAEYNEAMQELEEAARPVAEEEKATDTEEAVGEEKAAAEEVASETIRNDESKSEEELEAESEEVRKAKRAKAKAAYGSVGAFGDSSAEALASEVIAFSQSV